MLPQETNGLSLPPIAGEEAWKEAERLIARHRRFLLTTHTNPDGDGLGSQVALRRHLLARGKEALLVNPNPFPPNLQFLDPAGETLVLAEGAPATPLPPADCVFLIDASHWQRVGPLGGRLAALGVPTITVDHHPEGSDQAGTVRLIDTGACATGELIYRLIDRAGGPWNREVAEPLYVALLTDTGSFRHSNTTPLAHRIAARLLELGVSPRGIHSEIYERRTLAQMQLLGEALRGLTLEHGGRIVCMSVTRDMMERFGLTRADLEGFVDYTYILAGAEVGLQFLETADGKTRVSLRSKGRANVRIVAEKLGGGGHEHAAGILLDRPLEESRRLVLAECLSILPAQGEGGGR